VDHELIETILHGREERNIEYKSSVSWNNPSPRAKLIKSILAMANIRDGGLIVIGVNEEGDHFKPVGMSGEDFDSYSQDGVSSYVSNYADPFVEVTVNKVQYDRKKYVAIQVEEFAEFPLICKKDGDEGLRKGAIYTRTRRMHETAEVPSQTEMREIIENATIKAVRKFREVLSRAAIELPRDQKEESRQQFEKQLNGL